MPNCNTTSFLLNGKILIDAGTVTTLLTEEEQCNIECIFVTHAHLDHVKDIMFLSDNICNLPKDRSLTVYGTPYIIDALKTHLFNGIIWPDFSLLPNRENPVLKFISINPGEKIRLDNLDVTAVLVDHVVETVGYLVEWKDGAVAFIGDTGPTEAIWEAVNRTNHLKAIFIETSLPDDMTEIAEVTGHLTPSTLALELKKLNAHDPIIYPYHMKKRYQKSIQSEIALIENRNFRILQDGEHIHF